MSTVESNKLNKEKQSLEKHLEFAVDAVQSWPKWQQGLLQASAQQKLTKPRTIKTGVKTTSGEGN